MSISRASQEHLFVTNDRINLFYRHWPASGQRRGAIVMLHRGHEHSGRLAHLPGEMDLPDFDIFAWDARGHGRSPGKRGDAPGFATMIRDVQTFVDHIGAAHAVAP